MQRRLLGNFGAGVRTWHRGMTSGMSVALGALVGCGTPPAESPPPAEEESDGRPTEATPAEEPPPVSEPTAERAPESTEPKGPSPSEIVSGICSATCKQVEASCNERAAKFCQASCGDYVSAAEECPVEVRDALTCQQNADDFLLCSNIAAESCADLYRTMKRCRDGEVAAKPWGAAAPEETGSKLPQGFAQKAVEAHGFSQVMPERAKLDLAADQNFVMSAQDGAGIVYEVKSLELGSTQKPTAATILRTATKYVGNDCQPKLRLHGRFETEGVIHIRFDTVCKDGKEYHGMLHFWDGKAVVATTILMSPSADAQANPHLEPFLFGYDRHDGAPRD